MFFYLYAALEKKILDCQKMCTIQTNGNLLSLGTGTETMAYPMRSLHLREDDIDDRPNVPPLAGPEIDDLDPGDSGIDDGLLPPRRPGDRPPSRPGSRPGSRRPSHPFPTYPGDGEPGLVPIVVGIGLIINGRYNIKQEGDVWKADRINNFTVVGIFLITIINVFISAFGVADSTSSVEPIRITEDFDMENVTLED
ncbi:hypothetical protein C0J52_02772 [Blattella germanica]|nr:hypothetical protein C0J52_02772 [Blattella germanica]